MEISSLKKVWVYADIYEDEIPWVKVGQGAEVKFPFSSESVSGPITQLYPYLDAATRTVKARIELDNDLRELKPDMYADVTIRTAATAPVLTVPVEAVLFTGIRERVFLALGDGKFEPREVRTGLQDENGNIEIVSGLVSGDRVVTSAQFMLDSESKLREALQKMLNPEPAAASQKEELDDLF
jgi:Cu(I)/Ag(I) efflux system membrane fusion protein/cobalt-zinc-cadmium efflux system membrane fusion protein